MKIRRYWLETADPPFGWVPLTAGSGLIYWYDRTVAEETMAWLCGNGPCPAPRDLPVLRPHAAVRIMSDEVEVVAEDIPDSHSALRSLS